MKKKFRVVFIAVALILFFTVLQFESTFPAVYLSSEQNFTDHLLKFLQNGTYHKYEHNLVTMCTTFMQADTEMKMLAQNNTLRSFLWLQPWINSIVFSNDTQIANEANLMRIKTETRVKQNPYGMPIFPAMLQHIESNFGTYFVGFQNGDMIFNIELVYTLSAIKMFIEKEFLKKKLLIIGRRTNMRLKPRMIVPDRRTTKSDLQLYNKRISHMEFEGRLFFDNAEDYFIYTRDWVDWNSFPKYVIGRRGYDNAVVRRAVLDKTVQVISIEKSAPAIHQTADDGNSAHEHHVKTEEDKEWNMKIANKEFEPDERWFKSKCKTTNSDFYTQTDRLARIELRSTNNDRVVAVWDPTSRKVMVENPGFNWAYVP